jgi:exodeoxyribonuclease V gamma subunit
MRKAVDQELLELLPAPARVALTPALRIVKLPEPEGARAADRVIPLSLGALRRFLECPLQGAARYALGMMDDDDADAQDVENEPLTQNQLDLVMMLRDAFWNGRGDLERVEREYEQGLRTHQLAGTAPVGPFAGALRVEFSRRAALCIEQMRSAGIANLDGWERVRFGAAEGDAGTDTVLPPIELEAGLYRPTGSTTVRVSLRGTIAVSPRRDQSLRCISRASKAKPRDFLEGFLGAVVLAATGQTSARTFQALSVGASKDGSEAVNVSRKLKLPLKDDARQYLVALIEDLFSGANHYFLPIEAVAKIYEHDEKSTKLTDRQIWEGIEDIRDNEFSRCSSDYGPIRNPRFYRPPPPRQVREILKRRFDPIRSLFNQ